MARVLLVNQDRRTGAHAGSLLLAAGHVVLYVESPAEALDIVERGAVDVVVTGMMGSGDRGPRFILRITTRGETPVIALAGDNLAHRVLAAEYGAFQTMAAPVAAEDLLAAVDRAWEQVAHRSLKFPSRPSDTLPQA